MMRKAGVSPPVIFIIGLCTYSQGSIYCGPTLGKSLITHSGPCLFILSSLCQALTSPVGSLVFHMASGRQLMG